MRSVDYEYAGHPRFAVGDVVQFDTLFSGVKLGTITKTDTEEYNVEDFGPVYSIMPDDNLGPIVSENPIWRRAESELMELNPQKLFINSIELEGGYEI